MERIPTAGSRPAPSVLEPARLSGGAAARARGGFPVLADREHPTSDRPPSGGRPKRTRRPFARPIVVGLLGGIGAGKTTVAAAFRDLGAVVVDADRIARDALERRSVRARLRRRFGEGVFGPDRRVDRNALAEAAFRDEAHRRALHAIVHPLVRAGIEMELRKAGRRGGPGVLVLDVPLLLEEGLLERCDAAIFVHAPLRVRAARAAASRGWGESEVARREAYQAPLAEKRAVADFVIENAGSRPRLRAEVRRILDALRRRLGRLERGVGPDRGPKGPGPSAAEKRR